MKTTGDGVLAVFDSSERAVRAAAAICLAARAIGLAIRAGVHTGEVELAAGDVRGMAVHVAARVMALAGPSQVYVSATTRARRGLGTDLRRRGIYVLKGVSGARQLLPPGRAGVGLTARSVAPQDPRSSYRGAEPREPYAP